MSNYGDEMSRLSNFDKNDNDISIVMTINMKITMTLFHNSSRNLIRKYPYETEVLLHFSTNYAKKNFVIVMTLDRDESLGKNI